MKRLAIVTTTICVAVLMLWRFAVHQPQRLALVLEDYASLPITADNTNENTRAQLARVNYLRDEPGGSRFFVNDLNGQLYILDKRNKTFTTYLDFNGAGGRPGLFRKFTFEQNYATGLTNFIFDPDYARNGIFYTLHMEDPAVNAPAIPKPGVVADLDLTGYTATPAISTPTVDGRIEREVVLIEWKDRNPSNSRFEGSARELLRLQLPLPFHPLGEMTFNPTARPGDADWRVMYLGAGDAGSGEQLDSRRLNPQRLDALVGKILRIIPDLGEHTTTSTISSNGRYRVPNDNPFSAVDGARNEIWAYGLRNPHRLIWDVGPAPARTATLLAFNIGLGTWETVAVIHKGANYGYPLREGTQSMSSTHGMEGLPANDMIPVRISDSVVTGEVRPTYPVIEYPHNRESGGDAIANGFIYHGNLVPMLKDKLVFGDITTGRIWYANRSDVLAADDGNPATVAPIHEIDAGLRRLTEDTYRKRGGTGQTLPGSGAISGRGRVDLRFATDNDGELYILTKSDGMIRKVVGAVRGRAAHPARQAGAFRCSALCREFAAALRIWMMQITATMLRRTAALFTCILVLGFSFTGWENACRQMSGEASHSHQMEHAGQGSHHGSMPASHHGGDTQAPTHCQNTAACGSISTAPVEAAPMLLTNHLDRVFALRASAPSSVARDLETPPPRA